MSDKAIKLTQAKTLYDDLRERIENGIGADIIDDTAGAGNTDKAWSADKITSEFNDVIAVQDATPTEDVTKIWLPVTAPSSVQVPSYTEFTELSSALNDKYEKPSGGIPAADIASGVIPSVDNTLAVSGAAADAKETGAVRTALNGAVKADNINNKYNLLTRGNVFPMSRFSWSYGGINDNAGTDSNTSKTRLRSGYCACSANTEYKVVGNGYIIIHFYASDKSHISAYSNAQWKTPVLKFTTPSNTAYMRFLLKKSSAGSDNFDDESASNIDLACYPTSNTIDVDFSKAVNEEKDLLPTFASKTTNTNRGITWTWNADGSCTANGTYSSTDTSTARCNMYEGTFPVTMEKGCIYRMVMESESNDLSFYLSIRNSSNTALYSRTRKKSLDMYVPNEAANLIVRVELDSGVSSISNKKFTVRLFKINPAKEPVKVNVCTYNVGAYNYGYAPSAEHPVQATATTVSEMKEFFRQHRFDILALQEAQNVILDSDLTTGTNVNTAIYDYLFPYKNTSNTNDKPYSPGLYSVFPTMGDTNGSMTGSRRYASSIVNIHGIRVFVLSVHLALTAADRATNYDEIAALVAPYKHWIVLGDLNAGNDNEAGSYDASSEYNAILARGWHTANGGYWGQFNTLAPSSESTPARYLDSVLTSPNIDINTYDAPYLRETMPSDHRPLMCELMIYPDGNG